VRHATTVGPPVAMPLPATHRPATTRHVKVKALQPNRQHVRADRAQHGPQAQVVLAAIRVVRH
jgi:hypothetical protein